MARPPAQFLDQLAGEGLSGAEALRQLRAEGFTYSDQAFYQTWGRSIASVASGEISAGGSLDTVPTFGETAPAPVDLTANYLQKVVLTLHDRETGELSTRLVSISTDDLLTRQEAIDYAIDLFADDDDVYGQDVTGGSYANTQYRV